MVFYIVILKNKSVKSTYECVDLNQVCMLIDEVLGYLPKVEFEIERVSRVSNDS